MARVPAPGKLYPLFTVLGAFWSVAGHSGPAWERIRMVGIAIAMFIALFGWGANYFGWSDPEGKVQLALFTSFILGVISGYKTRS